MYFEDNVCQRCYDEYFLNLNDECVTKTLISECATYQHKLSQDNTLICLKCNNFNSSGKGIVLNDNKCEVVDVEISNCVEYFKDDTSGSILCKECAEDYVLSANKKNQCFSKISNCNEYTFVCSNNTALENSCDSSCNDTVGCLARCLNCEDKFYTL